MTDTLCHVHMQSDPESDQNVLTHGTEFTQGLTLQTNCMCLLTNLDKQIL